MAGGMQRRAAKVQTQDADGLVERYLQLVDELPQARRVLVDESCGFPAILTVIEATPWDIEQRRPIYRAEAEVMDAFPDVLVDWDLVNLAEYPERTAEEILPTGLRAYIPQQ